jgi:sodium-dependent dicarboxylate transporter 2/3/5
VGRIGFWTGLAGLAVTFTYVQVGAPLPEGLPPSGAALIGVTWLMAWWWMTEAIDLAATSLIPVFAFPLLGIMGIGDLAGAYSDRFVLLLLGGFIVATAIERWGLHRRLALATLRGLGTEPRRLLLGFMLVSAGLSMWISNTATALMMLPIAGAVLARLSETAGGDDTAATRRFATALMLTIAYSASIGGLGTPIGTPPNAIFLGQYHETYPEAARIGFLQWMLATLPVVAALLVGVWAWMTFGVARIPRRSAARALDLRADREALGPISVPERRVAWVFAMTAALWITRVSIPIGDTGIALPGWADLLGLGSAVDDSTVAMAAAVALFALPAGTTDRGERLLDWPTAAKIPWGIILLFGGGIALARAFRATGLSELVGHGMAAMAAVPPVVMILGVCLIVTFLTEVTSNTATASVLLPILAATADAASVDPIALMVPATLSASCAFMLPVATPPNAIVFGSGRVTIREMASAGLVVNLFGAAVITLIVWWWGVPLLGGR